MENNQISPPEIPESGYFFSPSSIKLLILSICTFSFYELYWFYKNWDIIKKRNKSNISPFWRSFFAPIWAYSLFKNIRSEALHNGLAFPSIFPLTFIYVLLSFTWRLDDPYWLVSMLGVFPIIVVNSTAFSINKKLDKETAGGAELSSWNWFGILVGFGLWALIAIELF